MIVKNQTKYIRNFSIIAHIDHGKSTLSDRIIEICSRSSKLFKLKSSEKILDSMDLEREKGITIKAQNVTLRYISDDGNEYQLNLIDTPGHMDFIYEVFRSLSACEGALLVIDARKGIQAQTLDTLLHAKRMDVKVIPVINKIDLIDQDPSPIVSNISRITEINANNFLTCSAKTGYGIKNIIENVVRYVPSPSGREEDLLEALIIDSWFDRYLGIIFLIRIKSGRVLVGDRIKILGIDRSYCIKSMGIFNPNKVERKKLSVGEIGWIICKIKHIDEKPVGRMITHYSNRRIIKRSSNIGEVQSQIYSSLFPTEDGSYQSLRDALIKLHLNDSSFSFVPECSDIFGNGFNCGFLGLFHLKIMKERLRREYNVEVISTIPKLIHEIEMKDRTVLHTNDPNKLSAIKNIKEIREPFSHCKILSPKKYFGKIIDLCAKKRGKQIEVLHLGNQILLIYEIPTSEVISDFLDLLKSVSEGYASLEHKFHRFKKEKIVCVDILINGKKMSCLSSIVHQKKSKEHSKKLIKLIVESLPRQQFNVIIQAAIGKTVIMRS
ncbi:Translation elongation factor LepA [Candidatus Riesia pediculischaeffi PTSU]|uniref:Elongation factor 4 n=1 Tax=Candidatus Riesia pediculischaeffi PTSU TaxID=1401651 RepID=A0A0C1V7C9_9ENTR|nr:Translation elongation factor LepA [Candidatus Riesia pediculischaeffi PTSU]